MAQGFGAREVHAEQGENAAQQREPSMEEILASIRRIIEDGDPDRNPGDTATLAEETVAAPERSWASGSRDAEPARPEGQVEAADTAPQQTASAPEPAIGESDALRRDAEKVRALKAMEPADPSPLPRPDEAEPAILSEKTSRKVAASFAELSEAFEANRRKSLDLVAEEMLRPMLREWLDENLPDMVERLVRAEIERLTRG